MVTQKPTLAEVRELLATMLERSTHGWIGEGEDIAREIFEYIDGESPDSPQQWKEGIDKWAYIVKYDDLGATRGPFDSHQQATEFLASMPEKATPISPIGPTADRDSYVVVSREEFRRFKAQSENVDQEG